MALTTIRSVNLILYFILLKYLPLILCSVSDGAIEDFSENVLSKDRNNAAKHVSINYQGRKKGYTTDDPAPLPLLTVNQKAYNIPTISKLIKVYDNYIPDVGVAEQETKEELEEEHAFIDEVAKTEVMKELKSWLQQNSYLPKNMDDKAFNKWLFEFWFTLYSRGKHILGSSAFEHVFLGEIKNNEVSGFHNWVYFADQENKKAADYQGWKKYSELKDKGSVLKFSFKWSNVTKYSNAMFVGTSPELEMALYTTCFLARPNAQCKLRLNGTPVTLQTYIFTYKGKKYIGTAFPDL